MHSGIPEAVTVVRIVRVNRIHDPVGNRRGDRHSYEHPIIPIKSIERGVVGELVEAPLRILRESYRTKISLVVDRPEEELITDTRLAGTATVSSVLCKNLTAGVQDQRVGTPDQTYRLHCRQLAVGRRVGVPAIRNDEYVRVDYRRYHWSDAAIC